MRVKFFVLGVLMVLMMKTNAQQGTGGTLTLQQAIDAALKNNTTVKQSEFDMQLQGVTYNQAKGNMLPDITGNINHGINQGRSIDPFTNSYINQQVNFANYNLNSNVTVFNGFLLLNTLRQQSLAYDAAKMNLQQNKDIITLRVILAYLQALNADESMQRLEAQADLTLKQLQRLEVLHKEGAGQPLQYHDLKGQLSGDELALVDAAGEVATTRLELARLMNTPYDKTQTLAPLTADQMSLVYEEDVEAIYQKATAGLATVKTAELRRRSAEKGLQAAKGWYSPQLFLSGNLNTNYSSAATTQTLVNVVDVSTNDYVIVNGGKVNVISPQNNFTSQKIGFSDQFKNNYSTSLAVGLRIPILNGLFARNSVAQARIILRNEEFNAQSLLIQLKQDIEEAYINMRGAQQRYKALQEQVAAYAESFRIAEVRFNAGLGTSIDYLVAKNNLDRANLALVRSRYEYVFRMRILDYYQAKPLF